MPDQKIILIAFPDALAVNLVNVLIQKEVRVVVMSEKTSLWKPVLRKLRLQKKVELVSSDDHLSFSGETVLVVDTYFYNGLKKTPLQKKNIFTKLKLFFPQNPIWFLTTLENYSFEELQADATPLKIRAIICAQVYQRQSKRPFRLATDFAGLIAQLNKGQVARLQFSDKPIYPVTVETVAGYLTHLVTQKVKEQALVFGLAEEVQTLGSFLMKVVGKKRNLKIIYDNHGFGIKHLFPENEKVIYLGGFEPPVKIISPAVVHRPKKDRLVWLKRYWTKSQHFLTFVPVKSIKRAWLTLCLVALILFLPVVTFFGGSAFLIKNQPKFSKPLFLFSAQVFNWYDRILPNSNFQSLSSLSGSLANLTDDLVKLKNLSLRVASLTDVILGKEKKLSFSDSLNNLKKDLFYYHRDLQFLLNDFLSPATKPLMGRFLKEGEMSYLAGTLPVLPEVLDTLPSVFGVGGERTYLVLLQNQTELRPTGGFVGSFALVNFQDGRLNEVKVMDVYDADGQLKGHVEPPAPIAKYLGEANWFLRDANWDPDFATTAQRVMWFLDKEMEMKVDGVWAIDASLIQSLVEAVGEVTIPDFNQTINAGNFYEVVQYESEKDFFPGSTRKANFLGALTGEMVKIIKDGRLSHSQKLGQLLLRNLKNKHLQVYLNDTQIQKTWNKLGLGWRFSSPDCEDNSNCFSSTQSLVEANVGVNKASYYLGRQVKIEVYLTPQGVHGKTAVLFENQAPSIIGYKGVNKTYLRLFAPLGTTIKKIWMTKKGTGDVLLGELENYDGYFSEGSLVEIPNATNVLVEYEWENSLVLDTTKPGQFLFTWLKQYGTPDGTPVTVTFYPATEMVLTKGHQLEYNCTLSSDCTFVFDWK